jgi:CRP-like cAMP-binding protein
LTESDIKHIARLLPMQDKDMKIFLSKFKPQYLKKGDYYIREGEKCKTVGFIVKGCMLCSYNKDGAEVIDEFSLDKEFITDYHSFLTGMPADKDVKCLEDTELMILKYQDLQKLYNQNPIFERVGRLMAEALFINWQQKAKSLLLDDAEARYLKLVINRPDLPQRVPQYLIASYLGVAPETLSRIRKRISRS